MSRRGLVLDSGRSFTWRRAAPLAVSVGLALLPPLAARGSKSGAGLYARVVEIRGDVHIGRRVIWRNGHYRIHGNLVLEAGGLLELDHSTVELVNTYARQYAYHWNGGKLASRFATLGGTLRDGAVYQSNIELYKGEWECTDTTVRYCYGIVFGHGEQGGRLRATRLIQGPFPDSIIMTGRGDAVIRDSTYAVALNLYADRGGSGVFDLPVDRPIHRVFDGSNVPGAEYRLELINTTVPGFWFLFANNVTMDGPPVEVTLQHCPRLIPCIGGYNLRGRLHLPHTLDAPLTTGNVTWRRGVAPVPVIAWGVYLSGDQTDLTLLGPTTLCEWMLFAGKSALIGEEGTYNAVTTATTIEAGWPNTPGQPEMTLRNVAIGRFAPGDPVKGQITAHGSARITIERARCADLLLITKEKGSITLKDLRREGEIRVLEQGGPIRFLDEDSGRGRP